MPISRIVFHICLFVLFTSFFAYGCGKSEGMDPEMEKLGRATGPVDAPVSPAPQPMAEQKPEGALHRGDVLETIHVPNYTYILIKTAASGTLWTAIPSNDKIRVGQNVEIIESVVMKDFTSRSLGRTFSTIIFGILKEGEDGMEKAANDSSSGNTSSPPVDPSELPPGHPPINKQK